MVIGHNGRFSKNVSHDEICAFTADSRQLQQGVKVLRHFPSVLLPQNLHTGIYVSGLTAPEAAGPDNLLNFIHVRFRQRLHIGKFII